MSYTFVRDICRGDVVSVERPIAAIQRSDTKPWIVSCPGCSKHVGDLNMQLAVSHVGRAEAFSLLSDQELRGRTNAKVNRLPGSLSLDGSSIVPCIMGCGDIYCSEACRHRCWESGHCVLCVGPVQNEDHPLLRFKLHALSEPIFEPFLVLAAQLITQAALKIICARQCDCPSPGAANHNTGQCTAQPKGDEKEPTGAVAGIGFLKEKDKCLKSCAREGNEETEDKLFGGGETDECGVVRALLSHFPRGGISEKSTSGRGIPSRVSNESWSLLVEVLAVAGEQVQCFVCGMNAAALPYLLDRDFHSTLLAGLVANCIDMEVQSPLVDYAEALLTRLPHEQEAALQILEPLLAALEGKDELSGDGDLNNSMLRGSGRGAGDTSEGGGSWNEEGHLEVDEVGEASGSDKSNEEDNFVSHSRGEIDEWGEGSVGNEACKSEAIGEFMSGPCCGGDRSEVMSRDEGGVDLGSELEPQGNEPLLLEDNGGVGGGSGDEEEDHLKLAHLAWRCVEAARSASTVFPPLSIVCLLPSTLTGLSHSCTPPCAIARDPGTYGGKSWAGKPLSVFLVALRDVKEGQPMALSWLSSSADVGAWSMMAGETFLSFDSLMERMQEMGAYGPLALATCSPLPKKLLALDSVSPTHSSSTKYSTLRNACNEHVVLGVSDMKGSDDQKGDKKMGFEKWVQDWSSPCKDCAFWLGTGRRDVELRDGRGEAEGSDILCAKCQVQVSELWPLARGRPLSVSELTEGAERATRDHRYEDAFEALKQAMEKDTRNGDLFYRAGVCAINQGRWSRALKLWRDGLTMSQEHPQLREEADKYDAYAYWRHYPICETDSCSHGACKISQSCRELTPPFCPAPAGDKKGTLIMDSFCQKDHCVNQIGVLKCPSPSSVAYRGGIGSGDLEGRHCELDPSYGTDPVPGLRVRYMGGGGWVCVTPSPVLLAEECQAAIDEAEAMAAASISQGKGGWGTARHYSVPTTDVAVKDLPQTIAWFNRIMRKVVQPLVVTASLMGEGDYFSVAEKEVGVEGQEIQQVKDEGRGREEEVKVGQGKTSGLAPLIRVHDAFIVRYDAEAQQSLPTHTDQSEISLTITLNASTEYDGGGTWFEGLGCAVRPEEAGHVVIFPGGEVMHGGEAITRGVRYVIAVFMYEHRVEEEDEDGDDCSNQEREERGSAVEVDDSHGPCHARSGGGKMDGDIDGSIFNPEEGGLSRGEGVHGAIS